MVDLSELLSLAKASDLLTEASRTARYIPQFADALKTVPPRRVDAVVSLLGRRHVAEWSGLVVIARYRSPHAPIAAVARSLRRAVLEAGFVPLLLPVHVRAFDTMTWDTPLVHRIATKSVVLFRSDDRD